MGLYALCAIGLAAVLLADASAAGYEAVWREESGPRKVSDVLARGHEVLTAVGGARGAEHGILDVTVAPYAADPTGRTDSTSAIQRAVRDARDARMVCFFPPGRYLVSDTIVAGQRHVQWEPDMTLARDDFPCVLRGGTQGGRATIVLADNAEGFGELADAKPVLFFASFTHRGPVELQPNISFNQVLLSIDLDLGAGNAGAIGVDHQGAQGCVTEDVHIKADGAFAGFRGASGSGGGTANVSVAGGRYGMWLAGMGAMQKFAGSQPCPTVSNVTLTGQTDAAIYSQTRGPLTLVGAHIRGSGIRLDGPRWAGWNGALNVVDSVIEDPGDEAAIRGNRPVYLDNVYFSRAARAVAVENAQALFGEPDRWAHVIEYAVSPAPAYPIWVDGERRPNPGADMTRGDGPPEDLLAQHAWDEPLPAWNAPSVANVREAPYEAAGDGRADDTDAIQRALDENRDVCVPKGTYRLTQPLRLRADSRLFGLGVYSVLEPDPEAEAFADPDSASPSIVTPDDPEATCTVAFLQLWCRVPGSYGLHWRAGGRSLVRNVRTKPWPWVRGAAAVEHPMVLIEGNGGGRWHNALMHYKFPQAPGHRHVLARGTRQPLAFYMLNPEHSAADHMIEFDDVRNLDVFGLKCETLGANGPKDMTAVVIRNSSGFRILGHGGNATAPARAPLYLLENCRGFVLANFSHQPFQGGADPSTWFTLEEQHASGEPIRTPATEWFTLYRRQ
jgi:hypothetical protein